MRTLIYFFILLSYSYNVSSQSCNSEQEFRDYLKDNLNKLDPIEGIWSVSCKTVKYIDGSLVNSDNQQDYSKWFIINVYDTYKVCNIKDKRYFEKTASGNIYQYKRWLDEEAKYINANVYLSGFNVLEFKTELFDKFTQMVLDPNATNNSNNYTNGIFIPPAPRYATHNISVSLTYNLIKLYPTQDMLNEQKNKAEEKKEKEASKSGTGFAITTNGLIVTNNHIIEGAIKIKVKGIKGDFNNSLNAKLITTDIKNDIAVIQIDDDNFKGCGQIPYTIKSNISEVGSDIYVLGYPLRATMGDEIKLTNGIISAKSGFQGDITSYQISAPINPGNSGAPLFNKNGNVIGIVNAKNIEADNAGYAIKTSYLMNLIESLSTFPRLPTINTLSGKYLTEQVKLIKNFVYIIEVN